MSLQLYFVPLAGFAGLMVFAAVEDSWRLVTPSAVVMRLSTLWPVQSGCAAPYGVAVAGGALIVTIPPNLS